MSTQLKNRKARSWNIALSTFLWLGILFPWTELDFFNGANALIIALAASGLGISELTSITSYEDLTMILAGFVFSIGIFW